MNISELLHIANDISVHRSAFCYASGTRLRRRLLLRASAIIHPPSFSSYCSTWYPHCFESIAEDNHPAPGQHPRLSLVGVQPSAVAAKNYTILTSLRLGSRRNASRGDDEIFPPPPRRSRGAQCFRRLARFCEPFGASDTFWR